MERDPVVTEKLPHPATVKLAYLVPEASGAQVKPIPTGDFLPGYFNRPIRYAEEPYQRRAVVQLRDQK